ncbi:MAG: STAS domain-containing protein [Anaerolineales bacterium]|nr:STAS domain-containing protein [Anaerolineales bacterium]
MSITVEQAQGKAQVAILAIHGDLDASNYQAVINQARQLYASGTRALLIDMSDMLFMASSGLVALHSIALLFRGKTPPDPEHGWDAFHSIDRDQDSGVQQQVKLLNPQPRVNKTLEVTGLKAFFEIYTDREAALASFE